MQKKFLAVFFAVIFAISTIPIETNSANPQPSPLNNILYLHTDGTISYGNKWVGELWMNANKNDENSSQNYRETTTRNQDVVIEFPQSPELENDLEFDMTKNITIAIAMEVYYGNIDSNITATLYAGSKILGKGETEFLGQSYRYTNATYHYSFQPNFANVNASENLKLVFSFHTNEETNIEIYSDSGQSYIVLPLKGASATLVFTEPNGVDDNANNSFRIMWKIENAKGNEKISLYYDDDNLGNDGKLIVSNLPITTTEYLWDTSLVANGSYYVYAVISDGTNISVSYSDRKIMVRSSFVILPEILDAKVSPESGDTKTDFTFTLTYKDKRNYKANFVYVFIDGKENIMSAVNISDTIYTDGKEYSFSTKLSEGKHTYYFKVGNEKGEKQSEEFSLNVEKEKSGWFIPFLEFGWVIGILTLVGILRRKRKLI